ncbi:hypothetical protein GQX74_010194 [Glossina fuscipes]|nr:hypothetical protein GQX74_010194 [Glossina fuscipes]
MFKLSELWKICWVQLDSRVPLLVLSIIKRATCQSNISDGVGQDKNRILLKEYKDERQIELKNNEILAERSLRVCWERCRVNDCAEVLVCFKCRGFNHIAMNCNNDDTCHKCRGGHDSEGCLKHQMLYETWFKPYVDDKVGGISSSNAVRHARTYTDRGGGIAFYIKNGLNSKIVLKSQRSGWTYVLNYINIIVIALIAPIANKSSSFLFEDFRLISI